MTENDLVHLLLASGIETFVAEHDHKNKNKVELEAFGGCGDSFLASHFLNDIILN